MVVALQESSRLVGAHFPIFGLIKWADSADAQLSQEKTSNQLTSLLLQVFFFHLFIAVDYCIPYMDLALGFASEDPPDPTFTKSSMESFVRTMAGAVGSAQSLESCQGTFKR